MRSLDIETENARDWSEGGDPLHRIINAYLKRATRIEKDFYALNREIEILILSIKAENQSQPAADSRTG
jgi:hypothetical protein